MSLRSMMLMLAVGTAGLATAAADPMEKTTNTGGGFVCTNGVGVGCIGSVAVLPITINIKDVRALNSNELTVLSNDLNHIAILDEGVLNNNTILNDLEAEVLTDFLDKFDIDVDENDINVCTNVLGIQLCK